MQKEKQQLRNGHHGETGKEIVGLRKDDLDIGIDPSMTSSIPSRENLGMTLRERDGR